MLDKLRLASSLLCLVGAAVLLPPGCKSSDADGLCDDMCDCTGCREPEYRRCIQDVEESQQLAQDQGCPDLFDAYITCIRDEFECRQDELSYDGCEPEQESLFEECGVSVFLSACELATDFLTNECGFGVDPGGQEEVECTGAAACQAECILDSTCQGFTGEDFEENTKFIECINGC